MDEFRKHCGLMKELIEIGKLVPHVVNSNLIKFRYDNELMESYIRKEQLERKSFRRDLQEIPLFILAALIDNSELLFRYLIDDELGEEEITLEQEKIREKIRMVEDIFITVDLRNVYKIKSTAKSRLLKEIDWEINEKLFNRSSGELSRLKYAQLYLDTADRESGMPFFAYIRFPVEETKIDLLLTITSDDIDYLLQELTELKKVLSNE